MIPQHILVAGGAGFLGSHVCDRLIDAGHWVYCLDDLSTGAERNIHHLRDNPRFVFARRSITDPLPYFGRLEAVYNFACPASPPLYQRDPVRTLLTSVVGVHNLLELARTTRAVFFHASTSEIYGDPAVHPQHESYNGCVNPIGRRACYDEGKRAAETLCFDYHREYSVAIKIARIFNTYGPRMLPDDGRVVTNFIMQALAGEPLTVYGDGSQTRSLCYVEDTIDAILRLMGTASEVCGPVNIGNPSEISIHALAEIILAKIGARGLVYRPLPSDDPTRRCPDINLSRSLLGWEPGTDLDEGLDRTIAHLRALCGDSLVSAA